MELTNSKNFVLYSKDELRTNSKELADFLNSTNYTIKIDKFDRNKKLFDVKYQSEIKCTSLRIRSLNIMTNLMTGYSFKYYIDFEDEDDEIIFKLSHY